MQPSHKLRECVSSHKLREYVFHSLSSCSFPFLVYVRHFLNHIIVFLAPPLPQLPRQTPSSPNGSVGTGCDLNEHRQFVFDTFVM